MASRFVRLSRAAIRSPASGGYGLLRRVLAAPSTVTPAAQGFRLYAGSCRPDVNEAVSNVQRTVRSIETNVSEVARRLDALEPRMQTKENPDHVLGCMLFGASYGFLAGMLLHAILLGGPDQPITSKVSCAKKA